METFAGLGTRMRHLLELLDGDVVRVYANLGLPDYRPRFSPVVRALVALGPLSIRDLARAVGVTHSAASQTVAQMARVGLLTLEPGADARQRIASLTARTRQLLPLIEAEWAATDLAAAELEAELPAALGEILLLAERAVVSRPMRNRISDAARTLHAALPPDDPDARPRAALLAIAGEDPEPGLRNLLPDFSPASPASSMQAPPANNPTPSSPPASAPAPAPSPTESVAPRTRSYALGGPPTPIVSGWGPVQGGVAVERAEAARLEQGRPSAHRSVSVGTSG